MKIDLDCNLTPEQWETLKGLRTPRNISASLNRYVVEKLIAAGLASINSGSPAITAHGRQVLIRGSLQLLDVAA